MKSKANTCVDEVWKTLLQKKRGDPWVVTGKKFRRKSIARIIRIPLQRGRACKKRQSSTGVAKKAVGGLKKTGAKKKSNGERENAILSQSGLKSFSEDGDRSQREKAIAKIQGIKTAGKAKDPEAYPHRTSRTLRARE